VRRPGLDAALVETARAAGAEVRERSRVTGLVRDADGRVAGVRWSERDGDGEHELRAPLVVGADGRRSLVAHEVGAEAAHTSNENGRACFFAYLEDPHEEWRATAAQWREGRELGTAFPCDGGLLLVLLMPPRERGRELDWDEAVARIPALRERLDGCKRVTKVRSAIDTTSYFRRSAGPGWALAGDAGHFKDPVTAQGIRDAVRFGRLLGEATAPLLDGEPAALDRAVAGWERRRDRECAETYVWTNTLARAAEMSPLEIEMYRAAAADPDIARRVLDVFARTRRPTQALTLRQGLVLTGRALRRRGADRRAVARGTGRELRDLAAMHASRLRALAPRAHAQLLP
jgi:flavin-dependent dehydrogenase